MGREETEIMFDIEIRRTFAAAHRLRGYNGPCRRLHGHNYSVVVTVRTAKLDDLGLALDFNILKERLDGILDGYDHRELNELDDFKEINPTSENLARTIYRKLAAEIDGDGIRLHSVRIGESENSAVTYFEE